MEEIFKTEKQKWQRNGYQCEQVFFFFLVIHGFDKPKDSAPSTPKSLFFLCKILI